MISISIIIPVYNVEPYILTCLRSVAAQTYQGEIECLIVDDCGQDRSMEIAEEFVRDYQGEIEFRVIHREKNGGLSAARNTGIREAKGDYLYFLDSDDSIIPECLQLMVDTLCNYPTVQCVFAGAKGYEWMSYEGKELPEYSNNPKWITAAIAARYLLNMTAWNRLIRRDFVLEHSLFFDEGWTHEDEIWSQDLALNLTEIAICKHDTYQYLIRNTGIIGAEKEEGMFEKRMKVWNHMVDKLSFGAPDCMVGALFLMEDFSNIESEDNLNAFFAYLRRVGRKSDSPAVMMLRLYSYLPNWVKCNKFVLRILLRKLDPFVLINHYSPIV